MLTTLQGDARLRLRDIPSETVHCVVTSPPYFGLRDYGVEGQIGLESTPEAYIEKMVEVFREVRRVLRKDGTVWLNLGDSYANDGKWGGTTGGKHVAALHRSPVGRTKRKTGLKPKDLLMIPHRTAMALQQDGWWVRSDIVWSKPNPMPESVEDRPTRAHEYIFLLSKSERYFYDAEAIKEKSNGVNGGGFSRAYAEQQPAHGAMRLERPVDTGQRNKRSVWTIPTQPTSDMHFAAFPEALVRPCILAGTSAKGCCVDCGAPYERMLEKITGTPASYNGSTFNNGKSKTAREHLAPVGNGERSAETRTVGWQATCSCYHGPAFGPVAPCAVLDPFAGSGTTGRVALKLGRRAILIELNPDYVKLINRKCSVTLGLALPDMAVL